MANTLPLRTPRETAERLVVLAAVSGVASGVDREEVVSLLKQEALWDKASPSEQRFLSSVNPPEKDSIYFSWQMKAVYVLGWALRLLPKLASPKSQASIGDILEQIPGPGDSVSRFVDSSSLRPALEIHKNGDSILAAHAYCRGAKSRSRPEPQGYDIEVAQERHRAINWFIRYEEAEWDDVATDT